MCCCGQLWALVWKQALWCKHYPGKLLTIYVVPLLLTLFLPLTYMVLTLDNVPNCDYHSLALAPSHTIFTIQSLVCAETTDCTFDMPGYRPSVDFTKSFFSDSKNVTGSRFCPGLDEEQLKKRTETVMFNTCVERKADYIRMAPIDFVFRGHILLTPSNAQTEAYKEKIIEHFKEVDMYKFGYATENYTDEYPVLNGFFEAGKLSVCFKPMKDRVHIFENRTAALDWAQQLNISEDAVWGLVELEGISAAKKKFSYNLITHYNLRMRPSTLLLQSVIESLAMETLTNVPKSTRSQLQYKMLPKRCAKDTKVYVMVLAVSQYILTMGVAYAAYLLASGMAFEKETGLAEFLLISNVSKWKVRLVWIVFGWLIMWSAVMAGLAAGYAWDTRAIEHSSFQVILVLVALYSFTLIALCFLLCALCKTATAAGMATFMLLLVSLFIPGWAQFTPAVGYNGGRLYALRLLCTLLSPMAVQMGFTYVFAFESYGRGVNWTNLSESPAPHDDFGGVQELMIMLGVQIVAYTLLAAYKEWRNNGGKFLRCSESAIEHREWSAPKQPRQRTQSADVEHDERNKTVSISIVHLTKDYGSSSTSPAVDDLSAEFYSGDITAILGHNGAGKSTTMNILTGILKPTEGSASINGSDIQHNMGKIRQSLSYCPQHNIIYPHLTFRQHLQLFGDLRRLPRSVVKKYTDQVLEQMKVAESDQNIAAEHLSGGTQRKLSIAIAFLGEPDTVVLDEPTSAIDAFSRRTIWDLLLSYRGRSTILISTHNMLEADLLGDRIVIIDHGKLKCAGTSMYLKQKYGDGAMLTLAHEKAFESGDFLVNEITQYCSGAVVESSGAHETKVSIPATSVQPANMSRLCLFLEDKKAKLGLTSFGVSEPTMNQVFFKVTMDPNEDEDLNGTNKVNGNTDNNGTKENGNKQDDALLEGAFSNVKPAGKICTCILQIEAVLSKRIHLMRRSWAGLFFQVLLPALLTIILIIFNQVIKKVSVKPDKMVITPWNTSIDQNRFFYSGPIDDTFAKSLFHTGLGNGRHPNASLNSEDNDVFAMFNESISWSTEDEAANVSTSAGVCRCSICPSGADLPHPPSLQLPTGDLLLNMNDRNVTEYLLKTNLRKIIGGITRGRVTTGNAGKMNDAVQSAMFMMMLDGTMDRLKEQMEKLQTVTTTTTTMAPDEYDYDFDFFGGGGGGGGGGFGGEMEYPDWMFFADQKLSVDTLWSGLKIVDHGRPTDREKDMKMMPAAVLNTYSNLILRSHTSTTAGSNDDDDYFEIIGHSEEAQMTADVNMQQLLEGLILGSMTSMALTFPALYILLVVVNEASSGNRQLQYVHGLSPIIYWVTNFVWDASLYAISIGLMIGIMECVPRIFDIREKLFFTICMTFGVEMVLFAYLMSFVFDTGRSAAMIVGILGPFVSMAASVMLFFRNKDWFDTATLLGNFFPMFFVTDGCQVTQLLNYIPGDPNPFEWQFLGRRLAMAGAFIAFVLTMIIVCECAVFRKIHSYFIYRRKRQPKPDTPDEDVAGENRRLSEKSQDYIFRASNMVKKYTLNGKLAVDHVSFGVKGGECFGLLGVNGAGKTSLFRMITGYSACSAGDMHILNINARNRAKVARYVSYCPQDDILFDNLTVTEHLHLYGRIRGIKSGPRTKLIKHLMQRVGIAVHSAKKPGELSGGNKRKLNASIALLNRPQLIFLDEMTTGLDPRARQFAWKCLTEAVRAGSAVVITSHSIEECEALCDRLGIMVNGRLLCVGGVQYLKDRFGNKYHIKLRVTGGIANVDATLAKLQTSFGNCHIAEKHVNYAEVDVPATPDLRLSRIFTVIDALMTAEDSCVTDFSVSQTTLEQVFVNMVKEQD